MSRISVFQPLYFLLLAAPEVVPAARDAIDAWEKRTGLHVPRALRELYSTNITVPLSEEDEERTLWSEPDPQHRIAGSVGDDTWTISLHALWSEFWEGEFVPLDACLRGLERALRGARVDELEGLAAPPDAWKPLVYMETDVMRIYRAFVELDGSEDPPVVEHTRSGDSWARTERTFSHWFFQFIVDASTTQDNVPYSFWGPDADHDASLERAPVMLFRNGLWLRAVDAPLADDARSRLPRADNGLIQVVSDHEQSSWFIGAEDEDALAALVGAARASGALTAPLHADTPQAREALLRPDLAFGAVDRD